MNGADRLVEKTAGPRPVLAVEELRLIQELVRDHCGLAHGLDSAFFLERRLLGRLEALGLTSFNEYYHYLRYDPDGSRELETAVERLTTHETYFFREQYQLDAFAEEVVPRLVRNREGQRSLTVWSAGCSTGEEAYTLAIVLHDHPLLRGWRLRVVGSDLSRRVITKARAGCYGPSSFRTTSPEIREKYFVPGDEGLCVRPDLRAMCSFGQFNLVTAPRSGPLGPFDAVFCRNVLMYLSVDARIHAVDRFYDALVPGGFLLLGHSESLLNIDSRFDLVHLEKDLVYAREARP